MSAMPALWKMIGLPSPTPDSACLALVKAYGGKRLYVPRRLHADHRLCTLLGPDSAAELVKMRAGEYLPIPLAHRYKRAQFHAIVASAKPDGWSQETIANRFRISRRTVQRIMAARRVASAS